MTAPSIADRASPRIRLCLTEDADPAIALPEYATEGAAGADLRANLQETDRTAGLTIYSGRWLLVPTGLRMELPQGFEVQVRPRSGLALKHGLSVLNTPGTIDSDYRGPVGVILMNHGESPFVVAHGDRIAQMVVAPVVQAGFDQVTSLSDSDRGTGGFGSTGVG